MMVFFRRSRDRAQELLRKYSTPTGRADAQAKKLLRQWKREARWSRESQAVFQVEVAEGYLTAIEEAAEAVEQALEEGEGQRIQRTTDHWFRMHARFWRHYRDTLAGIFGHDPSKVEALWEALTSDPNLARYLEGGAG